MKPAAPTDHSAETAAASSTSCASSAHGELTADIVLFADSTGSIISVAAARPQHTRIMQAAAARACFWEALGLGAASLQETLRLFPPLRMHEISCGEGQNFLLRIIPLPPELAAKGGYLVITTDNRPMEALRKTYEERLEDNITAWSDSITLFNAIFDTAKDPTLLVDASGVILTANLAASGIHAREGQPLAGTPVKALFGKRFHPSLEQAMRSLRPKCIHVEKVVALDRDGEGFPAEAILRKIVFTTHSVYQLIVHDLTTQEELRGKKAEVKEMNITLRQVIRSVEEERQELREQLTNQVKAHMLPALERVAKADSAEIRGGYISLIEEHLAGLAEDGAADLDPELLRLSPRELRVCQLIQMGRNGKDISKYLSISFETVQTHRKNIRRKLGLRGKGTSLYHYLRQKLPIA